MSRTKGGSGKGVRSERRNEGHVEGTLKRKQVDLEKIQRTGKGYVSAAGEDKDG